MDGQVLVGSGARLNYTKVRAGGSWVADLRLDDLISESEATLKKELLR